MVSEQKKGWFFFGVFAVLILAGVAMKRLMHHPEMIMFFHVPAAVFLALAARSVPAKLKARYKEQVEAMAPPRSNP